MKHRGDFYRASRLALLILLTAPLPLTGRAQTAATYHARADQALQSFFLKFWNGGQQYLRNRFPSDGSLTGYWTYANGWDALLDGVERTGGAQYAGLMESFYLGQNTRGWTNNYYDDECWMTLALVRARPDNERGLSESGAGVVCGCADRLGHRVLRPDQERNVVGQSARRKPRRPTRALRSPGLDCIGSRPIPRISPLHSRFTGFGGPTW
jgi:hypothetical protein